MGHPPAIKEKDSFSTDLGEAEMERPHLASDEQLATGHPSLDVVAAAVEIQTENACPSEGNAAVSHAQQGPDVCFTLTHELLSEISRAISSQEQCISLAVKLKIGEDDVFRLIDAPFTTELTRDVLKTWVNMYRKEATGVVLHSALRDSGRVDLAERFKSSLLGRDAAENDTSHPEVELTAAIVTDNSERTPPFNLLHEIAAYVEKRKYCIRLAENLGLGKDFADRLREKRTEASTMALDVLRTWRHRKGKHATGRVLFNAFIAIRRRDIAACFALELLGREEDDWLDYCYDDTYRAFFRLLQRRGIDVFAVYESMECSEDFLAALRRTSILTLSEYEKVLECSQTFSRTATNRHLVDIINKKRSQVHEMFSDQLNQHQPQLLVKEASASTESAIHVKAGESCVGTSTPPKSHGETLLLDFKEQLSRFFNQLLIVRPLDFVACEDYRLVNEMYVTLSSISYEEALKLISSPQRLRRSQLMKAASQVDAQSEHSQELLDLHSLIRSPEGTHVKSALLFGLAGSGKSLTTLKILSEWTSKTSLSMFKQFDAIIYATGKERSRLRAMDVAEFWQLQQMGFNEQQSHFILGYFLQNSERVLFLIDGWDEAGDDGLLQEGSVLKNIVDGELFPQSSIVITSRPAPNAYPLLEKCYHRYSLVGFNDKRLKELFNRHLNETQTEELFTTLTQASNLHIKAVIQKSPLFAAMLAQLYKTKKTMPSTITSLYHLVLESMRSRYARWMKELEAGDKHASLVVMSGKKSSGKKSSAKADFDDAERKLGELALAGLISNKVTFSTAEVMCCGKTVVKSRFGLLSELKEISTVEGHVLYHFNHLTLQEYLAARSLAAAEDPDFIKKLQVCAHSIGVGEHLHMFWRFLAGLVSSTHLTDLVFEVLKVSGVSGMAPWETEIRLLLLECVAENIRMGEMRGEPLSANNILIAAQLLAVKPCMFFFNDHILDTNALSSLVVVLKACKDIRSLSLYDCQINHRSFTVHHDLGNLDNVELRALSGKAASSFVQTVLNSLIKSHALTSLTLASPCLANECLGTLSQLLNYSQTLAELIFANCNLRSAGVEYLSKNLHCSLSLQCLLFQDDDLAGAGGFLGELCARMPLLANLAIVGCHLDDDDFAGLLVGLQSCTNLTHLQVARNKLSAGSAALVKQFAVCRNQQADEALAHAEDLLINVAGNNISEEALLQSCLELPPECGITVTNGNVAVSPFDVVEIDHGAVFRSDAHSIAPGYVNYKSPGMGAQGTVQIAEVLTGEYAQALRSISLTDSDVDNTGAIAIARALPGCRRLEGLDLSNNCIGLEGFHHVLCALSTGSSLQYLNVGCNPVFAHPGSTHSQLTPSILNLSNAIRQLNILGMSSTNISDNCECFENSAFALMAIPSLSALDLSNNDITDKSVSMITEQMVNLEYLSLSGNRIGSDGGKMVIAKADTMVATAEAHGQRSCRLRRVWLGGNNIDDTIFAECRCKVTSSEVFSIKDLHPKVVQASLSSAAFSGSQDRHSLSEVDEDELNSPFWTILGAALQGESFLQCFYNMAEECFNRWFTRAVYAVARCSKSSQPVDEAHTLINLFTLLVNWYLSNSRRVPAVMAVAAMMVCVVDELALTFAMPELDHFSEQPLGVIARLSAQDSEHLCLAIQIISGIAECCRQQQLHAVAERLEQQLAHISEQALMIMISSA